jgi:hypothetical protein
MEPEPDGDAADPVEDAADATEPIPGLEDRLQQEASRLNLNVRNVRSMLSVRTSGLMCCRWRFLNILSAVHDERRDVLEFPRCSC